MQSSLFNLNFISWSLLLTFIVPGIINIGIFIYVFFFLPYNKTNKTFSAFVLLLGIAQALDGIMRMSATSETAMQWSEMTAVTWFFITPFELLFIFRYTGWDKKIRDTALLTFLFAPAIALGFLLIAGLHKTTVLKSEQWNWIVNPQNTFVTNISYLWGTIISLICFALYWIYFITVRNDKEKRKFSLIIAIGNTVPTIIGIIAEVIVPLVYKKNDIPITTPFITAFSIAILVAITRFKVLDFSPIHQLDRILEVMNEGLMIVNIKGEIMYANPAFCKEVGYELSEMAGKMGEGLLVKEQEEIEKLRHGIKNRIKNIPGQYEILGTTKQGKKVWFMLNATPYIDTNGHIIGSVVILTNINDLKGANKELELFIYKASHDLRGPLASILGLSMLVKQEKNPKEVTNYLNMIDTSAKKLDTILVTLIKSMQIRDVKKFEDEISFDCLLNEIQQRFIGYEEYPLIEITKNISVKENVVSNKLILESVFQNIIENAIKYSNPEVLNSYLRINITETETAIEILFEDNGIGIDPTSVDKIFDMYYRGSNKSKGTGLGLYLVKNGINKLGGTIKVESELGKGTKFIVSLQMK